MYSDRRTLVELVGTKMEIVEEVEIDEERTEQS